MPINLNKLREAWESAGTEPLPTYPAPAAAPKPGEEIVELPPSQLEDFPRSRFNRYEIHSGEAWELLRESIRQNGILQPLIVRPLESGQYQVISGKNRKHVALDLGLYTVPCIIRLLDDDEALEQLNIINVQQRELRPSERAFAYELEARRGAGQGFRSDLAVDSELDNLTLCQVGTKLNDGANDLTSVQLAPKSKDGQSKRSRNRLRRLCHLHPDGYLDAVDAGLLGVTVAAALSYLRPESQQLVYDYFFLAGEHGPVWKEPQHKLDQTVVEKLRILDEYGQLTVEALGKIFLPVVSAPVTRFQAVKIKMAPLRKKYPALAGLDQTRVTEIIDEALALYYRRNEG